MLKPKFKSGDIVYYNNHIGIFIDTDVNIHRPLFICPSATCEMNNELIEYSTIKMFLNIEDDRKLNYWGFKGFKPDKNTNINILNLESHVLNMLLSKDIEVSKLTFKIIINQKNNGTL